MNTHEARDSIWLRVVDLISHKLERSRAAVVPAWWLALANTLAEASGLGQVELAARLSRAIGRKPIWKHTSVGRFLKGKALPADMARAFVVYFGMPEPVYYPASPQEAMELAVRAKATEASSKSGEAHGDGDRRKQKMEKRLADGDAVAAEMEREAGLARGQRDSVTSPEHGGAKQRRPRGRRSGQHGEDPREA